MSNTEHIPTHQPVPDASFEPLGYILGIQFHESLKLVRKKGLEFGAKLSAFIDPRGIELQDGAWIFSQPLGDSAAGLFRVTIQENTITLEARLPTNRLDWFERRYEIILDEFQKTFKPTFLISSMAKVLGTIPIDGDAREFLFNHVVKISKPKFGILERPVHIVGIRLGLPAFEVSKAKRTKGKSKKEKGIKSTEWAVDIKAESLAADTRKVYLEATGQWPPIPREWNGAATKAVITRLATVKSYLKDHFISFLTTDLE